MRAHAVLLLWMAACHTGGDASGPSEKTAHASGNRDQRAKEVNVAADENLIRKELAHQLDAKPSELEVTILTDANVPGVTVFTVYAPPPERGENGTYGYGVVHDGRVVTNRSEAMNIVARAWGYGPKRTVPPEKVALVFGTLEGRLGDEADPLVKQRMIDRMSPERRQGVFLPRETEVDGDPAVEYWVESPGDPGLWRSQVVFHPGGKASLRVLGTRRE
jgi:hypothetical protein